MKKIFLLGAVVMSLSLHALPIEKPKLRIIFKIRNSDIRNSLTDRALDTLEKNIEWKLAHLLSMKVPLFAFTTSVTCKDILQVSLIDGPSASDYNISILLAASLTGPNVIDPCPPATWEMAQDRASIPDFLTGNPKAFLSNVLARLSQENFLRPDDLVRRVLKSYCIKEPQAAVLWDDRAWVFQFKYGDLEVGKDSEFRVFQKHKLGPQVIDRKFLAQVKMGDDCANQMIMAELLDRPNDASESGCKTTRDEITKFLKDSYAAMIGFQVISFTRLDRSNVAIPPDPGALTSGGANSNTNTNDDDNEGDN